MPDRFYGIDHGAPASPAGDQSTGRVSRSQGDTSRRKCTATVATHGSGVLSNA
jgi:hypothetical protein